MGTQLVVVEEKYSGIRHFQKTSSREESEKIIREVKKYWKGKNQPFDIYATEAGKSEDVTKFVANVTEYATDIVTQKISGTPINIPVQGAGRREWIEANTAKNGSFVNLARIHIADAIGTDVEYWLDMLSEVAIGDPLLMDIDYTIYDSWPDGTLILIITGDPSACLETAD